MDETSSSAKTKVIAIFLILFLIALGLGVMYSRNLNQNKVATPDTKVSESSKDTGTDKSTDQPPTNEPTLAIGNTDLNLTTDTDSPVIGTPFKVTINTVGTSIVSADFFVNYDPKVLEFVSAEKGKIFDLVLKSTHDITKGQIRLSTSIAADGVEKNMTGEAMTITFKPISTASTQIALDPTQTIAALKGQNILNKANLKPLSVVIAR